MHAAQRSGKPPETGPTRALAANSGAPQGPRRHNGVPDGRALYRRITPGHESLGFEFGGMNF